MEIHDIFPTKVLVNKKPKLDINKQEMMKDIDNIILDGKDLRIPTYQSFPILFQNWKPHWSVNWENLANSFSEHVMTYLSLARESYGPPEMYEISYVTAWFYRKDMVDAKDTHSHNPIHNHYPAQVVGVYYLDNPGVDGTTMYNPNQTLHQSSMTRSFSSISGGWTIFPGWVQHSTSSGAILSSLERTVIACNAYLKTVE
jgi:hypothetical protein